MAFKLYEDKSSVRKKNSRYVQGGVSEFDDRFVRWWERRTLPRDDVTDSTFTLTATYELRPDLVAFDYYGRSDLAWLVLQYNKIVDINTEFVVGKEIILPSRERVFYEILNRNKASKRLVR